jgi:hypothetical protein
MGEGTGLAMSGLEWNRPRLGLKLHDCLFADADRPTPNAITLVLNPALSAKRIDQTRRHIQDFRRSFDGEHGLSKYIENRKKAGEANPRGSPIHRLASMPASGDNRHDAAALQTSAPRTFTQLMGLEIRAAVLMFTVDTLVFGGDVASLGALIPVAVGAGAVLGFIVYKIQCKYYGDDHDAALIKALVVGLLTAIPVPIGPVVAVPSGLIGIVNTVRRKWHDAA